VDVSKEVRTAGPRSNPLARPTAILLAALSLSIGWGIRGNYGHELGAMLPGALAAIAVCLLSGREDWRERVAYFGLLGGLGWAIGGSMSYMQVLAYTQSGHAASQFYGFWALFLIGFLWAALGGGGTALPATLDRKSLCDMFAPLSVLLALWGVLYFVQEPLTQAMQTQFGLGPGDFRGATRHESILYWFDSNWFSVFVVLLGVLIFDLVDRRFSNSLWLPVFAAVGGALGHLAQLGLIHAGFSSLLHDLLVRSEGDTTIFDSDRLVTNWPELFDKGQNWIGLAIGVMAGIGIYFAVFGKFRRGSSLFLHMALGWFAGFLLLPVLLDVRMTPPRGDNWAGVLGALCGGLLYAYRQKWHTVIAASLVCGTIGGIGFSGVACLEWLMQSFGNRNRASQFAAGWTHWQQSPGELPASLVGLGSEDAWQFWRSANWHSLLEQSYGFVNGIGVVVAMSLLVRRTGALDNEAKRQRWTELMAVIVVLPVLIYVNLVKNIAVWTHATPPNISAPLPTVMRMPLVGFAMSAEAWFNILFGIAALAMVALLSIHARRRLEILEQSWLGRGQLLFLVLLWTFVVGNWGRALASFEEQRLLTEGAITVNAVLASMLALLVPRSASHIPEVTDSRFGGLIGSALLAAVLCAAVIPPLECLCVRSVYGDAPVRSSSAEGPETRFGPHATWHRKPLLKGIPHR
jgi:hypothetical protein